MKQPSDDLARRAAIDPARSFLVQAPAGSGKTELLTDRILALLATVNRPEEIVAITFTRKAASEMQARVLGKLASGAQPPPPDGHKRQSWELARQALARNQAMGWDLLHHPARLAIRTIDAFCSQLVRAMPWSSTTGGLPAVADDARAHYEAAAQATLALLEDDPAIAQLAEHLDLDIGQAAAMLANMLGQRDQWLPMLAHGADPAGLVTNLQDAIAADLQAMADQMPPGWPGALHRPLLLAANALAQADRPHPATILRDWDGTAFPCDHASVPMWQALASMLLTQTGTLRRTVNVSMGCPPGSEQKAALSDWLSATEPDAGWIRALHHVHQLPASGYQADHHDTLAALVRVLWVAAAQLQLQFRDAGEIDFIEVAQRAVKALGDPDDPTDLLLVLDNRIRHILVDEFQDTSQSQIDLLARLTSGWEPGDGRTLFLVGDPMQSIYRFRKAEVGWFLRVRESGLGQLAPHPLELTDNFRSDGDLVAAINRLCQPMFPQTDDIDLGAIPFTCAVPYQAASGSDPLQFHPVWAQGRARDRLAGQPSQGEVAATLAQAALERHADAPHPVAVLVRSRGDLDDLVHHLDALDVPYRAVDLVRLRSRQVVIDLVQLARALSHPGDRLAWLSVLRSPLCGLTLSTLHRLFGHDHHSTIPDLLRRWLARDTPDTGPDSARLRHVAAILLDDANVAGTVPFAAWLQQCWNRLQGPAIWPAKTDQADVESVFRLVESLAPYGELNPAELEARLDTLYAASASTGPAIDIMTIHKAKGLEFETVIVMGLCKSPRSDTPPLIRFEHSQGRVLMGPIKRRADDRADAVTQYLAFRDRQRAAYETDRLLYVAMTRARSQLHLVGSVMLDSEGALRTPASASFLARLWGRIRVPEPPELCESPVLSAASEPGVTGRALERWSDDALATLPDTQAFQGSRLPSAGSSWVWRERADDERIVGVVAHAWLERMGNDGADAWPESRIRDSGPALRRHLQRTGLPADRLDAAAAALHETLIATLRSDRGQWLLRAARAHREWTLLDLSGRVSVIDLAISREQDWLIVDYKTGVPGDHESIEAFGRRMKTRYAEQMRQYCSRVQALDGRPARAALFFPRADLWIDYEPTC